MGTSLINIRGMLARALQVRAAAAQLQSEVVAKAAAAAAGPAATGALDSAADMGNGVDAAAVRRRRHL
jgi:hypothetical protein